VETVLLAAVLLTWDPPTRRENGTQFHAEDIALYTLRENENIVEYTTSDSVEVAEPRKGCRDYTVSVTDTDNQESVPSNIVSLCKRKGKKVRNRNRN
jgi:hypothetical protein